MGRALERAGVLVAAYALDRAIGDPPRPTHPARLMGRAITLYETLARWIVSTPEQERKAGTLLAVGLPTLVWGSSRGLLSLLPRPLRLAAEVWLAATAFASRDLGLAARRVSQGLDRSLEEGRSEVAMIVGRETAQMTEADVVRATVETVAENTSDGVVAPLVFAALGGAPLALGFKAVSTLDSMVGYKNERYLDFGRASARLDDALNLFPARLTAMLATLAGGKGVGAVRRWLEDRRHHASPNAGLVEASFAQALGVRLGGPARYGGIVVERPAMGAEYPAPVRADIDRAIGLSERVGYMTLGAVVLGVVLAAPKLGSRRRSRAPGGRGT